MTEAEAWTKLTADLAAMRRLVLEHPLTAANPQVRAEAMALIHQAQASAYAMVIAPRQDFPRFFSHTFFEPTVFNWNLPNPDFLYQVAYLNGARTYRITGRRHSGGWCDFQVNSGVFGEPSTHLGNWLLSDLEVASDGSFEIVVGAAPQAANWIRLDPGSGNNVLLVRRLVCDWEGETPPSLAIEPVDGLAGMINFDEAELARRVALAGDYVVHVIRDMNLKGLERLAATPDNQFLMIGGAALKDGGANPVAVYGQARYALEPDEALIVESQIPDAIYWNFHLGDVWNQTRDFVDHLSSLNGRQARLDADGRFRAVIALRDPGTPNWLDPVGTTFGRICSRWYGASSSPTPTIRRVKLDALWDALPAGTSRVTPDQRRAEVRGRREGMLRLWGY